MIYQLVRNYEKLDRDIEALSNFLVILFVALVARAMLLAYQGQYDELWSLLGSITSIVAALLVSRAALRLITNGNIVREDEKRQEVVRVTHHLLAITQDLRARVGYVKTTLSDPSHPAFALGQVAITIERRYETLLDRDAYRFLPGKCVDIIIRISGSIFGIGALAEGVKHISAKSPFGALGNVYPQDSAPLIAQLDELMNDLQTLIDGIYEVRSTIDTKTESA
jgi:cytochrome b561